MSDVNVFIKRFFVFLSNDVSHMSIHSYSILIYNVFTLFPTLSFSSTITLDANQRPLALSILRSFLLLRITAILWLIATDLVHDRVQR